MLGTVALMAIVASALFVRSGLRARAACREAEAAEVLRVSVDIGAVGEHRATLKQIAEFPCRQYIRMELALKEGENAEQLLRGLELAITVKDAGGVEQISGVYPTPFALRDDAGNVTVVDTRPMRAGEYPVVIDVVHPAPALAGRPVQFVSKYGLCGLEWMGAHVEIGIGIAAFAVGTLIGGAPWATRQRSPRLRDAK